MGAVDPSAIERLVQGAPLIVALLIFGLWVLWNTIRAKDQQLAEAHQRLELLQRETLVVVTELKTIVAEQRREHAEVVGELKDAISALTLAIGENSGSRTRR
jgi:hypothetical protein